MRILFIGDIVGQPGVNMVVKAVPRLIESERLDLVVANAENASGGAGMTPSVYRQLRQAGVDAVTMGDHIYKKQDLMKLMAEGEPICKPANYPPEAPGREYVVVSARDGNRVAVFSLLGRLYMRPVDCPLQAAERVLKAVGDETKVILLNLHAEATGDKQSIGRYLDGKVSAVLGTHTHVPTADEQIFPGGTAYVTDVGMTGPRGGVIGVRKEQAIESLRTHMNIHFETSDDDPWLNAVLITCSAPLRADAIEQVLEPWNAS